MMRRIALAALAAALGTSTALSAEMKDVGDIPLGSVMVPQASAGRSGPAADAAVGAAVARAMGIGEPSSLRLLQTSKLPKNRGRSIRYTQLYRGIPILDQQVVVGWQAQGERAGVADQPGRDADEPVSQGGDHRLAVTDAVPDQAAVRAGAGGELVQPAGESGGEQRAPHPRPVDLWISRREVA